MAFVWFEQMRCVVDILKRVLRCARSWTWRLLICLLPYRSGMTGLMFAFSESNLNISFCSIFIVTLQNLTWIKLCFSDGMHFAEEGSKIVAEEILKALKEADWEPSLHWKSMPTEFAEDSPYDLLASDGNSTLNPSDWTFHREIQWDWESNVYLPQFWLSLSFYSLRHWILLLLFAVTRTYQYLPLNHFEFLKIDYLSKFRCPAERGIHFRMKSYINCIHLSHKSKFCLHNCNKIILINQDLWLPKSTDIRIW